MLCAQNGNGKVNRLVSNTNLPHTLGAYHSTDYGQTWNGFSIGTPSGRERVNEFFILSHGDEGDDARTMILRFQNRHGRYTNLHINFTPDASPKMAAYAQNDAGGWDLAWTLG